MAGVDLTTIEGIEEGTALVILSEVGTDMHRWPSVKHFCSWLGLCPQHKISGGKVLSRRGAPRAPLFTGPPPPPAPPGPPPPRALRALFLPAQAPLPTPHHHPAPPPTTSPTARN